MPRQGSRTESLWELFLEEQHLPRKMSTIIFKVYLPEPVFLFPFARPFCSQCSRTNLIMFFTSSVTFLDL